jgi:hypothetical protein
MVWPWVASRPWNPSSTLPCLRKLSCMFSCLQHQDVMQVLMSDHKIPTDFITCWWWVEVKFIIPQDQNIELHETENSFHPQSLVFKIWLVAIELGLRSSPFVLPLPHWIGAFLNKIDKVTLKTARRLNRRWPKKPIWKIRKFIKGRKPPKKVPMRKDGRGEKLWQREL